MTAPFSRLQLIFQTKDYNDKGTLKQAISQIYRTSGYKGFFKGNGVNTLKVVPELFIRFLVYDRTKSVVCSNKLNPTVAEKLFCNAFAGFVTQTAIYPLEIVKVRLTLAPDNRYKGIHHCISQIVCNERLNIFYKGWLLSILRIVPYTSIDLTLYHILRDKYIYTVNREPSIHTVFGCAASSSICAQFLIYPFTLVRTRLQSQGIRTSSNIYKGTWDCARTVWQHEGLFGFYRGLLSNFAKAIPGIAISRVIFEKSKSILLK
jgi:solute carrier family 25 phosphate transporter 23/24/25/41